MPHWNRRDFLQRTVAAGTAVAMGPNALAAANHFRDAASSADEYRLVDPELRERLRTWPQLVLTAETVAEIGKLPFEPALPAPAPPVESRTIPGAAGAAPVHLWICNPNPGKTNQPVLLHTHGGGYVAQNLHQYPFIQEIASACACVVVSVDYRLAPQTPFPGSLNDNYAALLWVDRNAKELGVDPARIAVGGESAGGGHAATLALRARDRGEVPLIFQMLLYPMLDNRTGSTRAVPPAYGQFIWNSQCNRFGWTSLLGVPAGSPKVPEGSVPARVQNLKGLPPAYIAVGSIDLFVEEDLEYAQRLIAAGVPTEVQVFPGAYHGFDILVPEAKVSRRFTEGWKRALRAAFQS